MKQLYNCFHGFLMMVWALMMHVKSVENRSRPSATVKYQDLIEKAERKTENLFNWTLLDPVKMNGILAVRSYSDHEQLTWMLKLLGDHTAITWKSVFLPWASVSFIRYESSKRLLVPFMRVSLIQLTTTHHMIVKGTHYRPPEGEEYWDHYTRCVNIMIPIHHETLRNP